jgi:hypothetical protein
MRYAIMILFAFGCSTNEPIAVPRVSDYFPLRSGAFQIYHVDSVVVKENVETAYNYELKTEVTDSFSNAAGGYTYVIQRFKRISSSSPWTALGSWSARADAFQAVTNEGNISYVKIASPLGNGKAWDGNALNVMGGTEKCLDHDSHTCDIYAIESFGKPVSLAAGTFDNTLTIVQNDNNDVIVSQDKRSEVYALNTGLVYREVNFLEYCTNAQCVGAQFVTAGLKYKQTISDYGGL